MKSFRNGVAAFAIAAVIGVPVVGFADDDADDDEEEVEVAELFLELNDTDGDLGLQGLIDHEGWVHLEIDRPNDGQVIGANIFGQAARTGLTEFFFESAEPTFDEVPPETTFRRFPEGIYDIEVMQRNGTEFESEVELSHVLPAGAENVTVGGLPGAEDCDADLPVAGPGDVLIAWDPVTSSHPDIGRAGPVSIDNYEFVVEIEDEENDKTWVLKVQLPPDTTEFLVPGSYTALAPEGEVKFEIGGQAAGTLNRTVVESCFLTRADD